MGVEMSGSISGGRISKMSDDKAQTDGLESILNENNLKPDDLEEVIRLLYGKRLS